MPEDMVCILIFGKKGDILIKSHFLGLLNILEILKRGFKKFVQIGSSAEYGKIKPPIIESSYGSPQTPYAIAKLSCIIFYFIYIKLKNFL